MGDAAAIKIDCLRHLATFTDAHTAIVGRHCVSDGVVSVHPDAVGNSFAEGGLNSPFRQAAVYGNVSPIACNYGKDLENKGKNMSQLNKGTLKDILRPFQALGCHLSL